MIRPIHKTALALRAILPLLLLAGQASGQEAKPDPLPSWNDGAAKKAILELVRVTTDKTSPKYVPPEERIATYDEDGTTWVEHPMYTEVVFSLDRLAELAPKHPEWKDKPTFKAVIDRDRAAMAKFSEKDLLEIVAVTHSGVTVEEFDKAVKDWIAKAKDHRWKRPYTELVYQPMIEVMQYLRANGYKNYIVTGGTQPFVRAFAKEAYGIPPEQVIGTSLVTRFTPKKDGKGNVIVLDPKLLLNNNYAGKAEDIYLFTGRRPVVAFGNTSGDQQMLEFTTGGAGARLSLLVMHDDAKREYAYGPANGLPETKVGAFSKELFDVAKKRGWTVISMKDDWKRVFAFEK